MKTSHDSGLKIKNVIRHFVNNKGKYSLDRFNLATLKYLFLFHHMDLQATVMLRLFIVNTSMILQNQRIF